MGFCVIRIMFKKGYLPWNKGKHLSLEHRQCISDSNKGRIITEEHMNKIIETRRRKDNYKHSEETKKKIREHLVDRFTGHKSPSWKGNTVKYLGAHERIYRKFGKAIKCENPNCVYPKKNSRGKLILKPTRFHWANISGEYKLNRTDWLSLCVKCHSDYDDNKITFKEQLIIK